MPQSKTVTGHKRGRDDVESQDAARDARAKKGRTGAAQAAASAGPGSTTSISSCPLRDAEGPRPWEGEGDPRQITEEQDPLVQIPVTFMEANVEGFGGGFVGVRDNNVIARIAEIFDSSGADVIAVLEVMLRPPPGPSRPKRPKIIRSERVLTLYIKEYKGHNETEEAAKVRFKKEEQMRMDEYESKLNIYKSKKAEWQKAKQNSKIDADKLGLRETGRLLEQLRLRNEKDNWCVAPDRQNAINLGGETVMFLYRKSKLIYESCEKITHGENAYRSALMAHFKLGALAAPTFISVCALHAPSPSHPVAHRMKVCKQVIKNASALGQERGSLCTFFAADTNINTLIAYNSASKREHREAENAKQLFSDTNALARQGKNGRHLLFDIGTTYRRALRVQQSDSFWIVNEETYDAVIDRWDELLLPIEGEPAQALFFSYNFDDNDDDDRYVNDANADVDGDYEEPTEKHAEAYRVLWNEHLQTSPFPDPAVLSLSESAKALSYLEDVLEEEAAWHYVASSYDRLYCVQAKEDTDSLKLSAYRAYALNAVAFAGGDCFYQAEAGILTTASHSDEVGIEDLAETKRVSDHCFLLGVLTIEAKKSSLSEEARQTLA